jgi:hypothetical protein
MRSVVKFYDGERDHPKRATTIVVVSPGQGDGKTSVSANLAAAFVEAGERTVAVNTDFRRPALSRRLVGYDPPARNEPLNSIVEGPLHMVLLPTDNDKLLLLDLAGTPGPSPSDLARATARILSRMTPSADAIVVDTSPVGATAEVLEFVPLADLVLVVVRLGHTSIEGAQRTVDMVRTLSNGEMLLTIVGGRQQDSAYYYQPSKPRPRFGRRRQPAVAARPTAADSRATNGVPTTGANGNGTNGNGANGNGADSDLAAEQSLP